MKNTKSIIISLLCLLAMYATNYVQSIYFYLEKGQEKCFKDEVVKNYVSKNQPIPS
jgi:hypothetical protein